MPRKSRVMEMPADAGAERRTVPDPAASTADLLGALADRDLSAGDREELLIVALDLCAECARTVREMGARMGGALTTLMRRELWRFFNHWPHGNGCPRDAPR